MDLYVLFFIIIIFNLGCVACELSLRFVYVIEHHEVDLPRMIGEAMRVSEDMKPQVKISDDIVQLDRENEDEAYRKLCSALSKGVSAVIDLSWTPWEQLEALAVDKGVTVMRTALGSQKMVAALDKYLALRNATDAVFILESEIDVDQTLYELLGNSDTRVWVHAGLTRESANALKAMRPEPSFYVLVGSSGFVMNTYARAVKEKLVRRDFRWNLVMTDYTLDVMQLVSPTMVLQADGVECCKLMGLREECSCPQDFKKKQYILSSLIQYLIEVYLKLDPDLQVTARVDCDDEAKEGLNMTRDRLYRQFTEDVDMNNETLFFWDETRYSFFLRSKFVLSTFKPGVGLEAIAKWMANEEFALLPGAVLEPLKNFFRIGTAPAIPWTIPKIDPDTNQPMVDENNNPVYEGYCIDLIAKLAEVMNFDYEIITPKSGSFGRRLPNGSWDGLIDDLMRGEIDISVAALTMTAEREEVIDFVAPYFEQTGILIVIRRPIRKTSLFKFMTVLRTEVWLSIVGALLLTGFMIYLLFTRELGKTLRIVNAEFLIRRPIRKTSLFKFMTVLRTEVWLSIVGALLLTGFMIWLLEKYSPYSARNNPQVYPYPCRNFTLKESFWFALTSFTPQGGGEAPKALSGRTLVAAYWLFVVLMLATFTANLAAFLTVERMQTPVSSLEQLARQSRINYTVVEGSTIHQYFINMKFAEDTLYRVWKEITLNATSDQSQYRVWDYPIREQYGHILLAINASGPVPDAETGFRQVNEHTEADFAFIHDSAEIKYELTRNCNLTEVGDVFAEQPYALAVQQGSRLQEDLSRALLDLQKERFLEQLASKYWNETARQSCPDADESEGITLESLGGVFIATLFGLGLAMITLAWEVFYYKQKEKNKVKTFDATVEIAKPKMAIQNISDTVKKLRRRGKKVAKAGNNVKNVTIGSKFKPAAEKGVSFISVYPKGGYRP